ncbi:hypothetical protein BEWA_017950 [Theileria equi strain WA]|uniref:Uncharacterized protein n=1 Tax=Theileria equi strain WA TaxID=1537102 RepID=L0AVP6_THEEQ|nr:hypothetical protein BEWA_017950 [Theileria equi strain WA]AFZ78954.1 hypothetical protein BEWA_017950 [Theileria equi strain WA]|eukprot:XP_004828620.1 hypothetical protein BEWA_017950 [Theileria equi strain WA]
MIGNTLFSAIDGRNSSPLPNLDYVDTQHIYNYTPKITRKNHGTSGLIVDDIRRSDIFDDPNGFIRHMSSTSLGAPELSKFESNVYISRYLSTSECISLLSSHCQRIMLNYHSRVSSLFASRIKDVTLSQLNDIGLFSSDHMRSLTIISICGRYHKLIKSNNDDSCVEPNIFPYAIKLLRLIYASVANTCSKPGTGNIEECQFFYQFLKRGTTSMNINGNFEGQTPQRITLLYSIALHLIDIALYNSNETTIDDYNISDIISYTICSFVEGLLKNGDDVLGDGEGLFRKTRFVPEIGTLSDLFSKHFSVLNGFLSHGCTMTNKSLLIKCINVVIHNLEGTRKRHPILIWAYIILMRLCPNEISDNSFKIPKHLFDIIVHTKNVLQLKSVTDALEFCLQNSKFSQHVRDNMNPNSVISIFVIHVSGLIKHKMADAVVIILSLFNTILDNFSKILSKISNILSGANNSDIVLASVEIFFNTCLFGKGILQSTLCITFYKLLSSGDITKCLASNARIMRLQALLSALGLLDKGGIDLSMDRDIPVYETAGRLALLYAFVKAGALPDILKILSRKFKAQNILIELRNSVIGYTQNTESLLEVFCTGELPNRLLAHDVLSASAGKNLDILPRPGASDPFIFFCSSFATALTKYPALSHILSQYSCHYTEMCTPSEFLRSALQSENPYFNQKAALLLFIHFILSSLYEVCDVSKQNVMNSLLHNTVANKYRKEVEKRQKYKEEYEESMKRIKKEHAEKYELYKVEIGKLQDAFNAKQAKVQNLESKISLLTSKCGNMEREYSRVSAEKEQIIEHLRQTKEQNISQETEINKMKEVVNDYNIVSAKLKKYQSDIEKATRELNKQNFELENLYRMLIYLAHQYNNTVSLLEKEKEVSNKYKVQNTQYKTKMEEQDNLVRVKDHKLNELMTRKNTLETEITRLSDEVTRKDSLLHDSNKRVQELQENVNQLNYTLHKREDYCQQIKQQLEEKERELTERRRQLNTIASACNSHVY